MPGRRGRQSGVSRAERTNLRFRLFPGSAFRSTVFLPPPQKRAQTGELPNPSPGELAHSAPSEPRLWCLPAGTGPSREAQRGVQSAAISMDVLMLSSTAVYCSPHAQRVVKAQGSSRPARPKPPPVTSHGHFLTSACTGQRARVSVHGSAYSAPWAPPSGSWTLSCRGERAP